MVGITLSVADKLRIAELLEDLGVDYIEAGWPGSNPKDAEFFQRWKAREAAREGIDRLTAAGGDSNEGERRRTKLAAFGATRYKNTTCEKDANVQALVESGAPVITLVAKAWDAQVLKVLEAMLEENLAMIECTVSRYITGVGRPGAEIAGGDTREESGDDRGHGALVPPPHEPHSHQAWDAQVLKVLEVTLEENLAMIDDTVRYFTAMDLFSPIPLSPSLHRQAWDAQVLKVLEATLEENLAMIDDTVRYFTAMGRHVMLDAEHFYDGFSANPHFLFVDLLTSVTFSFVPFALPGLVQASPLFQPLLSYFLALSPHSCCHAPMPLALFSPLGSEYSMQCVRAAARAGAKEIVLCDTNGGSMPWRVHVTAIGILQVKLGCECLPRDSLARLAEISAEIARVAGQPPNPAQPFVGANAFAHKGGIHVAALRKVRVVGEVVAWVGHMSAPHGRLRSPTNAFAHKGGIHVAALRKMPESYNHCDPSLVGNAMRSVVSDLSGRGNILEKAERAGLDLGREEAGQVLARIKQMEARGFAFENAAASVDMLIVRRGARYQIPAAEGNGPVDALNHALRASLDPHFPQLSQVELVDYRVRLLEPTERRSGTMSTTRVTIDFCDKSTGATWTTRRSGTMCAVRCSTVLGVVLVRWERRSGTMSTTRVTIDLCDKSFGATWTTRRSGTMSTTRATTDFCDKSSEATLTTAAAQCPPLGLPLSSVIRAQEPRGTMSPTQVPLISSPPPPPLLSPSLAALPPGGSTLIHRGGQFPRAHRRTGIRHRQLQRGTDL
ncbi:unnamed protein product [Closterium sp. Yama58-4]|nr:unnamed protein product [Closterium sp. Yama58-4]